MKSFFLIIVIFLTHFTLSHASKYDGAYTYTHFCKGEDSSKYDGSQFIIDDGILSNNRGGAGRWIIKKKFKVSDDGKLKFRGKRKDKKYSVKGKFIIEGDKISGKFLAKRYSKSGDSYKKCDMEFKRVGGVPEKISLEDDREITEINILSTFSH